MAKQGPCWDGYVNTYLRKVPSHMDFLILGSSFSSSSYDFSTGTQFGTILPFFSFMPLWVYPDQQALAILSHLSSSSLSDS